MVKRGKSDILTEPGRRLDVFCHFLGRKFYFGQNERGKVILKDIQFYEKVVVYRNDMAEFTNEPSVDF